VPAVESSGTYWCKGACPVNRKGDDCISKGPDTKVLINEDTCIGCGICVSCPFDAISIINLPEEFSYEPIHRYGPNMFSLYNLPAPKKNEVVGIIGRNGIGKSTVFEILAGLLKPNLGTDKEAGYDELIKRFKGTESQAYFEKLRDNKLSVAYKPQQVDAIPKKFNGRVIDLLRHADRHNQITSVMAGLELDNIADNEVKYLSGGELQKVAIAATVLHDSDVTYFDEPTSYLDIKQRLNIAKYIRKFKENRSILVVEHDLIILDYLTDIIHIMYGEESCYGIVSQPMADKLGINTYLGGYLKSENIRFRSKKISFEQRTAQKKKAGSIDMVSWPSFSKTLGKFTLNARPGSIKRGEIIGVLGQNGTGKTTFAKILSGMIKPDDTQLRMNIKISYKPQYLDTESDALVGDILKDAVLHYNHQIITPLEIERLLEKKLNQLSGGELQRVAIALCLSRDADLFVFDEASAYLDVEQRLIVSKVISEIVDTKGLSALVIDHDLLFIDYLAQRLMVFEGKPAVNGIVNVPTDMETGMNKLLRELQITLRRDNETNRPRINKEESVKDREQRRTGKYYYS
jgi:ATP-binding cassette, sub-family E, member 1